MTFPSTFSTFSFLLLFFIYQYFQTLQFCVLSLPEKYFTFFIVCTIVSMLNGHLFPFTTLKILPTFQNADQESSLPWAVLCSSLCYSGALFLLSFLLHFDTASDIMAVCLHIESPLLDLKLFKGTVILLGVSDVSFHTVIVHKMFVYMK